MNYRRKWLVLIMTGLIVVSIWSGCANKKKKIQKLQNFNTEAWMEDKNGCKGTRMELKDHLLKSKHFMRGLRAEQIVNILASQMPRSCPVAASDTIFIF